MKILAIETSCDETAISIINAEGGLSNPKLSVLSDVVLSQIEIHSKYGGVFPALAKREHAKNIIPLLKEALVEANLFSKNDSMSEIPEKETRKIFSHEKDLVEDMLDFLKNTAPPNIDAIAVTYGPGLEPALWVGINTAKTLSLAWNKPIIPVNHLEGHIASVLLNKGQNEEIKRPQMPSLALIISGGHTELIKIEDWGKYEFLGGTVDDAVGEAFDKVARMLDLPYPGGPPLSKMAEKARQTEMNNPFVFPRPMKHSGDLNFSFSGLKTSVLYTIKKQESVSEKEKQFIACAFEEAVADILVDKTKKALEEGSYGAIIVSGGVSANSFIRRSFQELERDTDIPLLIPDLSLSTDNACMIALAGFLILKTRMETIITDSKNLKKLNAEGNLKIG